MVVLLGYLLCVRFEWSYTKDLLLCGILVIIYCILFGEYISTPPTVKNVLQGN